MATLTVAAVQAAYVLMDRAATLDKVEVLLSGSPLRAADSAPRPVVTTLHDSLADD
jgi:hypothetical protein